jgi:hypothetical protein
MNRRNLLASAPALAWSSKAAEPVRRSLFEMRIFRLRNGPENQRQRTVDYLKSYAPLVKHAGSGPVAVFSSAIAEDIPFLTAITSFGGYAEMDAVQDQAPRRSRSRQGGRGVDCRQPPLRTARREAAGRLPGIPGYYAAANRRAESVAHIRNAHLRA